MQHSSLIFALGRILYSLAVLLGTVSALSRSAGSAGAAVLMELSFDSIPADTLLNNVPNWMQLNEPVTGGKLAIAEEIDGNRFLTTQVGNNQAGRYAIMFTNPDFSAEATLTITMDVWDPLLNSRGPLSTFPRAVAGIFELHGTSCMPPFIGIEHTDQGANDIAEWVSAGEAFADRRFGPTDAVSQDTWFTIQSTWNLGAGTKDLSVKLRNDPGPYSQVLPPSPIGFSDANQNAAELNALAVRLMRGTRIDNLRVEFNDTVLGRPRKLTDVAEPRAHVAGAPRPSDVQFSARFVRPESLATMQEFRATRNDWTFTNDSNYIQQIVSSGISYGGAQAPTFYSRRQAVDEGWVSIDWKGNLLTKPRFRPNGWWYADVNDQRYRDIMTGQLRAIIDGGGDRVHFDDPPLNVEMALLTDNPQLGLEEGVYSPASIAKFRGYLNENATSDQLAAWGIPSDLTDFDYRQYVSDRNGLVVPALSDHWVEFHFRSTEQFYAELKAEITDYAGFEVGFSANNFKDGKVNIGENEHTFSRIYQLFDWWIGELEQSEATPVNLWDDVRRAEANGKRQTFTLKSRDVALNRQVIAHTYALGTHMVAPWDVFLTGNKGQGTRFFGNSADFVDLFGFVRDHAELYDHYESATDVGPGIIDSRILSWEPIRILDGSSQVFAFARAIPGDDHAPAVVHLVPQLTIVTPPKPKFHYFVACLPISSSRRGD